MFFMVLSNLYCAELQKVSGDLEKKICEVGLTKILTESKNLFDNEANLKLWYKNMTLNIPSIFKTNMIWSKG